jgi:hypothetical protein
LNFLNKNIENNLEISILPKIFKKEICEIENEIRKRNEFDTVFKSILNFLNKKFFIEEEKRRAE